MATLYDALDQGGRTQPIDPRVMGHVVHALANAGQCSEVVDRVDAVERARDVVGIADVTDLQFHLGREIGRPLAAFAMYLRIENVQRTHAVAGGQQRVRRV